MGWRLPSCKWSEWKRTPSVVRVQIVKTFLLKVYQVCSKVVVELPQYCIVLMTAINCSVDIVYVYSGYSSSHNSPDIWCKISISSPGQQNYPKGSFRKLSQRALFELFYEHIPISLIPSLAMYISNQKISLQSTNCVVQLDRKLTWRRWCLWTGADLTADL